MYSSIFLIFATIIALAKALPNGAPGCKIDVQFISGEMNPPSQLGMSLQLVGPGQAYTPGQPVRFRINGRPSVKGLLLYAEPANQPNTIRTGKWQYPNGYRSNHQVCPGKGIQAAPDSIVTHSSPANKPTSGELVWTPDANVGDVVIKSVIALGETSWMVLNDIVLVSSTPGAPNQPVPPAPGTPGTPGQPIPGQPIPGQPIPGQPIPGQPIPGQPIPGQPIPGQPPAPGQPAPIAPIPGVPGTPLTPPATPVVPVPPPVNMSPTPVRPAKGAKSRNARNDDDDDDDD